MIFFMSKVLGIIAEYNPFHNGHLYHLMQSKKTFNADYTIAVMGGNFSQRGEVSVVNKWAKAEMALKNGVDLVIELPTIYAISSAENFAEGAIKILNSLKIVDAVSFGAETEDINALDKAAEILCAEPQEYKNLLAHELSKGLSFPKARENALMMYINDVRRFANVLSMPNNILAIEYLKALRKSKSNIRPVCITRFGSDHNDLSVSKGIASASAIRNMISADKMDTLEFKRLLPASSYPVLFEEYKRGHIIKDITYYDKEILYSLRKMSVSELANLPDVSEGLEFAIKQAASSCNSVIELLNILNSKRYTRTRLQRTFLYAMLGITKEDMEIAKTTIPYIRVLGFNENGRNLVSKISKSNSRLSVITSVKKFEDTNKNRNLQIMLDKDKWATDIYTLGYDFDSWANLDYTHNMIML